MAKPRRQLPFRVPHDVADQVTAAAEAEGISVNAWLMMAALQRLGAPDFTAKQGPHEPRQEIQPGRPETVEHPRELRIQARDEEEIVVRPNGTLGRAPKRGVVMPKPDRPREVNPVFRSKDRL